LKTVGGQLAYNVKGLLLCWLTVVGQPSNESPIELQNTKVILLFNRIGLHWTKAD
jgi:hypothetical protein